MQPDAPTRYEGWLSKRSTAGGAFANWKRRYIVLKRTSIAWYKSDNLAEEPAGAMQLTVPGVGVVPGKKSTLLSVVAAGRELLLEGPVAEIEQLRRAAEQVVADNRSPGRFSLPPPPMPAPPQIPVAPAAPPEANPFEVPLPPPSLANAESGRFSTADMADALFDEARKSSVEARKSSVEEAVDELFGGSCSGAGGGASAAAHKAPTANPFGQGEGCQATPRGSANPFAYESAEAAPTPRDAGTANPFVAEEAEGGQNGAAPKEKRRQTPATLPSMPKAKPAGGKRLSAIPGMGEEEEEEEEEG